MVRLKQDTYVAIVLLLACGVFFWDSFKIPDMGYASMGSYVWPRLVLGLLFVLSLGLLFQSLRQAGADAAPGDGVGGWLRRYRNALWCYFLFALFLVTLPYLGMLIGGVAFVFLTLTVLGERTLRAHAIHAAISLVTIGLMWSVFTFGLKVILPQGEIFSAW